MNHLMFNAAASGLGLMGKGAVSVLQASLPTISLSDLKEHATAKNICYSALLTIALTAVLIHPPSRILVFGVLSASYTFLGILANLIVLGVYATQAGIGTASSILSAASSMGGMLLGTAKELSATSQQPPIPTDLMEKSANSSPEAVASILESPEEWNEIFEQGATQAKNQKIETAPRQVEMPDDWSQIFDQVEEVIEQPNPAPQSTITQSGMAEVSSQQPAVMSEEALIEEIVQKDDPTTGQWVSNYEEELPEFDDDLLEYAQNQEKLQSSEQVASNPSKKSSGTNLFNPMRDTESVVKEFQGQKSAMPSLSGRSVAKTAAKWASEFAAEKQGAKWASEFAGAQKRNAVITPVLGAVALGVAAVGVYKLYQATKQEDEEYSDAQLTIEQLEALMAETKVEYAAVDYPEYDVTRDFILD
jgi:hypothetical protein